MTIASELTALQGDITSARAAVTAKGGSVTSGGGSSQLATDIATIPTGITPSGNINITGTSQVDVTNYATAQVVDADLVAGNIKKDVDILGVVGTYEGLWDSILPMPISITQIPITWKDGYRFKSGEEYAEASCSISNETIDLTSYTSSDFIVFVAEQNSNFQELNYCVYGSFYNASNVWTGDLVISYYSVYNKIWAWTRNTYNASNRSYFRLQVNKNYKPAAVYKISF